MSARKKIASKRAGTLCALFAAAAFFASCRVPPSPPSVADGSTVPIEYAVFSWKDEKDFKRISEYFTDEENTGANCVVRSDPAVRAGLYLILGIRPFTGIPAGSRNCAISAPTSSARRRRLSNCRNFPPLPSAKSVSG